MYAACDWLMPLVELILWLLPVAKHNETVYRIGLYEMKVGKLSEALNKNFQI